MRKIFRLTYMDDSLALEIAQNLNIAQRKQAMQHFISSFQSKTEQLDDLLSLHAIMYSMGLCPLRWEYPPSPNEANEVASPHPRGISFQDENNQEIHLAPPDGALLEVREMEQGLVRAICALWPNGRVRVVRLLIPNNESEIQREARLRVLQLGDFYDPSE